MPSAAQVAANRSNAQESTGPRTSAGKQTVSRNAETHGLTSKRLALSTEEQAIFDAQRKRLYKLHDMATEEERALADRYVEARWRLDRCRRVETSLFDQTITGVMAENPECDPDQAMAALFTDERHMKKMRLFLRYQAAIEREFYKAEQALNDYIAERDMLRAESPAVGFVSHPHPSNAKCGDSSYSATDLQSASRLSSGAEAPATAAQ